MKKSKQPKTGVSPDRGIGKSPKSGFLPWPLIVFLVGAGVLVWLLFSSFRVPPPTVAGPATEDLPAMAQAGGVAAPANPLTETAPVATPLSDALRQKLLGRWQRTDAEYAIEIRLVRPDGVTDARYYNPFNQRSIHVAKASVASPAGGAEFFMELQDVGYPGSTYTLRYDEPGDQLVGIYYQAAMRESYDVVFQRMRD
jgi:hypothetical protein